MSETKSPEYVSPTRILPLRKRWKADLSGNISWATFKRIMQRGEGPPITDLTERRRGVREDDWRHWLDDRRREQS